MTAHPPPQKPRLRIKTRHLIRKRRDWRRRALEAATNLATWPAGKPGRQDIEAETIKSLNKVRQWFRDRQARTVINAIQRRAVAAFRNQFDSNKV